MSTPGVHLAAEDVAELADLHEFLREWLTRPDAVVAFDQFVGNGFDAAEMHVDLARFVRLLTGADDIVSVVEDRW